jgi:hypothetical protein
LAEIGEGLIVHGEETHGGSVLRGHVGDGGTICEGELRNTGAVELYEFSDYSLSSQALKNMKFINFREGKKGEDEYLRNCEHKICGSGFGGECAKQFESNNLRKHHAHLRKGKKLKIKKRGKYRTGCPNMTASASIPPTPASSVRILQKSGEGERG